MAGVSVAYRETVVTFGENGGIVGILTTPTKPKLGTPHVLFLNSGIIHRVGANRIYVAFARTLAAAGVASLRFDLSGIGDSEWQSTGESLQESVHADIAAAVEYVTKRQHAESVALIGLCSGAFDAFDHALRDPRVAGAALLDMPGPFRNWSHFAVFTGVRLLHPRSWRRRVKALAKMNSLLGITGDVAAAGGPVFLPGVRGMRSHAEMRDQLNTLLGRGAKLAFIFTGGLEFRYNHRLQFRIRFPKAGAHPSVRVEFVSWSDHTLSTQSARIHVADWLKQWVLEELVAPVASPKPPSTPAELSV